MQELIHIISNLLTTHTCVIIPNLGGFIVNEKGATIKLKSNYFFPPQKELIFNSHLSHNDGLLVHALMQKENISFDIANNIITEKVRILKKELTSKKCYSLGDFGFFTLEKNGIIFHAKKISIENTDAFGLKEFYFPPIGNSQKTDSKNTFKPRKSSSITQIAIGGIAATIALFLLCQPIKNEQTSNYATLGPSISLSETIRNAELITKEKAEKYITPIKGKYYLIISEVSSEQDAFSYIRTYNSVQKDSLGILPIEEKFLITISESSSWDEINEKMKKISIQENTPSFTPFILCVQ